MIMKEENKLGVKSITELDQKTKLSSIQEDLAVFNKPRNLEVSLVSELKASMKSVEEVICKNNFMSRELLSVIRQK